MGRKTRYMPDGIELFEITNRTIQGRLLLRPGPQLNEAVKGILARAQRLYSVQIVAAVCLSNHFHLLITACSVERTASFMCYFQSNLAREAGRLRKWSGPFWDRRYELLPVANTERDQVARLRYLLAQGCKENLVWSPRDWPGFSTLRSMLSGKPIRASWLNRSAIYRAGRRGESQPMSSYEEPERLRLEPLPCWSEVSPTEYRRRVAELVAEVEAETRRRHRHNGTEPWGRINVLRQRPHDRPARVKRSPAPWIHAHSQSARAAYRRAYSWFLIAYRAASRRFRAGDWTVEFPPGCFRPRPPCTLHVRNPV